MKLLTSIMNAIPPVENADLSHAIRRRADSLTKPLGSLGRLEEVMLQYGLARGKATAKIGRKAIFVFCADHGIAREGVSAYPPEVTAQMVSNFLGGGAAISVLCRQYGIEARIVDAGVDADLSGAPGLIHRKVARGTASFLHAPAMVEKQAFEALDVGIELAVAAAREGFDILGAGEMGIGNTTAAAALIAAFTGRDAADVAGLGTGIAAERLVHKADVVRRAITLHAAALHSPLSTLAAVGGFEIASIAGLMLGAASERLPVVVDGVISSAAALAAVKLCPAVLPYLFFSHQSTEPGHAVLLDHLGVRPLLHLELHLGEGSGAALGIAVIESAMRLYNEMATFESAAVSRTS